MRRNTSDSNWLLPSENRTRRKYSSTHAATLFAALSASFQREKHGFPPTQFQLSLTKHFASHEKKNEKKVHAKVCFGTGVNTAPVFVCSVWWAPEDEHVNHARSPLYSLVLFHFSGFLLLISRERMSTPGAYRIGDRRCVCMC